MTDLRRLTGTFLAAGRMGLGLPLLGIFGEARFVEAFSVDRTTRAWLDVEVALARAQAEAGVIPESAAETIHAELASVQIDHGQLQEGTRLVGYPILPLLQQLGRTHPDVAAWLHFGATTQDIMDTALVLQLRDACRDIAHAGAELGDTLAALAEAHRATPMAGRTHGQQAVPISFGMKVAGWLEEIARSLVRLGEARAAVEVVQLYGAAGTSAAYGPLSTATRRRTAEILGLDCDDVPWHSVRDRLAQVAASLGVLAAATSRIALEVIDLARSEIAEVREGGGRLAGASSTMPQKANPVLSETIVGLSGMACALAAVPLRAMTGRHERSAGEWQMEWDSLPLLVAYTGSSLARCGDLVAGLRVDRARMAANLEIDGGLIMAEALMIRLAPLLGRQEAQDVVYDLSAAARDSGVPLAEAVRSFLADRGLEDQVNLEPASYLGEAEAIVDAVVERWRSVRRPQP
ncbi:MAG: adenylosuccinate lyase family protein [Acidimicrobiia bacterium]|nr:adenylosuccinate lyase family protein [Acidimicrobiia bacterium]